MAATLPTPADLRLWQQTQQSSRAAAAAAAAAALDDDDEGREESPRTPRRSSNRVVSRPAKPAVLNSILESLDMLPSPPILTADDHFSDSGSVYSHSYSADSAAANLRGVARAPVSPGFGVEPYGTGLSLDDEDGASDAALPPTVRTSRTPSGRSQYNAYLPPSYTPRSTGSVRTPSVASRRSSLSAPGKEKEGGAKNKLSAESWVKYTRGSHDSLEPSTNKLRKSRKQVGRMSSQEALRLAREFVEPAPPPPNISRADRIIARGRASPPPSPKPRVFLTDSGSLEEQPVRESTSTMADEPPRIDLEQNGDDLADHVGVEPVPSPGTPATKGVIADSIPTRTSSLRLSGSPAPTKRRERREKKSKRLSMAADGEKKADKSDVEGDNPPDGQSESIPESSWADLGEDDQTVRRIRELREKRKSRMAEAKTHAVHDEMPTAKLEGANKVDLPPTAESPVAGPGEDGKAPRIRPGGSNRIVTEPTMSLSDLGLPPDTNGVQANGTRATSRSPNGRKIPPLPSDDKRAKPRPATAKSAGPPTPPLSLDYSYVQAVDTLQKVEQLTRRDYVNGDSPSADNSPFRTRSKAQKRFGARQQERWAANHPDIPLDLSRRKSRRKSMSDARHTRPSDADAAGLPRRDSIEDAVDEFLNSPRLSRSVVHPSTGRLITFSELGDPQGAAVFICVGMGLTRYVTVFYDELATTLRLRLITVDRPGVGGSQPFPPNDRSGPLSWPEDVLAVCQHLGITKFSMLAHSAGAIYALATALIAPHLIQGKVHLLAPWIPPSQLEAISHPTASAPPAGALPRSQRLLRVLPTSFLKAANSSFMTATSTSLKPRKVPKSEQQRRQELSSSPPPIGQSPNNRPVTRERPVGENNRRESMMLMDRFMPDMANMDGFPIPIAEGDEDDPPALRGSLMVSATATPMDPSLAFASSALKAAEHEEQQRKARYASRLTERTWELATRDSNPATDLLVCLERHRDIGFRYTDVPRDVIITHGAEDKRVPVANVKWLAEQMNRRGTAAAAVVPGSPTTTKTTTTTDTANGGEGAPGSRGSSKEAPDSPTPPHGCEVRTLPGEGHGLMASPTIMGDVLTEIAGYWT